MASTSVYDSYGRMRYAIADSAGTSAGTRNNQTSYANEALDRLTSTNLPGGGTSSYAYDTLGRMTSRHHPDADGATRYKYDDLGRQRFSQDARQSATGVGNAIEKITFTVYDAFGRVTRVGEATATFSSLDPETSYSFESDTTSWRSRMTYDDDLLATGPNYAQGRLSKIEENTDADAAAEVVHLYAYDHLGSVRVKKVEIEGLTGTRTIEYVHDLAGRVTRLIYPDGAQARYAYDGAGRLTRVWDEQGNLLAAYTHTAAGNIDTHVVGEDIVNGSYRYNDREWVTEIDYPGKFTVTQQYDAVGNVTAQNYRRAASESEKAAAYTYDNLHRLTGFSLGSGSSTQSYEYDRNGNIDQVTTDGAAIHHSYSRSTTPNRLDSIFGTGGSSQSYAYNENGWMTAMGADILTYDFRGLTTGVGTAAYTMDPDRRRVKKTVGTVTTYYLRGAGGTVLAEYSGQALSAKYVYAGSRRIARVVGDARKYYIADHLGSTRSLVDESGTVTAAYDYWPYGKVMATSGTDATHFRFTGHARDSESDLDYMLERSYAFDIGRFLRPDPMQDEYPGISPYAYAANNPLKYVDPDGNKLRFAPGSSAKFRRQFASAVQYLNQHKRSARLARLERHESIVYIKEETEDSRYDITNKTILWNPMRGIKTTSDNLLSPTTALDHEAAHGDQDIHNPEQFAKDKSTKLEGFTNEEEKRVIYGPETNTARALGEIGTNEYTRDDHKGEPFPAESPTSNKDISELTPIEVFGEREEDPSP